MNRKVLIIGGIITFVLVGGVIVYGAKNNATTSSHDTTLTAVTNSTGSTLSDTAAIAPSATTLKASGMTASTATLHGVIDSNGAEVSYWFEYSADPLLGQVLNRRTPHIVLNTGTSQFPVEADLSALSNSTKYYVRLVVENGADTVRGDRVSFNTK